MRLEWQTNFPLQSFTTLLGTLLVVSVGQQIWIDATSVCKLYNQK